MHRVFEHCLQSPSLAREARTGCRRLVGRCLAAVASTDKERPLVFPAVSANYLNQFATVPEGADPNLYASQLEQGKAAIRKHAEHKYHEPLVPLGLLSQFYGDAFKHGFHLFRTDQRPFEDMQHTGVFAPGKVDSICTGTSNIRGLVCASAPSPEQAICIAGIIKNSLFGMWTNPDSDLLVAACGGQHGALAFPVIPLGELDAIVGRRIISDTSQSSEEVIDLSTFGDRALLDRPVYQIFKKSPYLSSLLHAALEDDSQDFTQTELAFGKLFVETLVKLGGGKDVAPPDPSYCPDWVYSVIDPLITASIFHFRHLDKVVDRTCVVESAEEFYQAFEDLNAPNQNEFFSAADC